ncbi:hypothetical protein FACS1894109_13600 [Spirochaetia bacterium]|nr:hypothetical protein FACS1894109_13600 [Spirochaetia bacterium]
MKGKLFVFVILAAIFQSAYSLETHTDLSVYGSTTIEMQVGVTQDFIFPLGGRTPLTKDSDIDVKIEANLTPFSFELFGDGIWSPLPFLQLQAGLFLGTGVNYDMFGVYYFKGMGVNERGNEENIIGNGLDGIVWNAHLAATMQFDLAAFLPGAWNHFVIRYYNEIQYQACTKANNGDWWYFKLGDGVNQNSFRYRYLLDVGYQMPIFLDYAGIRLDGLLPFYNPASGQDLTWQNFSFSGSLVLNFKVTKWLSIRSLVRMENALKHPVNNNFDRELIFNGVMFITTFHLK